MNTARPTSTWNWQHSYAELPAACFELTAPSPVAAPRLHSFNEDWASDLGLEGLQTLPPETLARQLAGNEPLPGAKPLAMTYAGHQFGHLAVLGDGRAILLGEHIDPRGVAHDIQFKGSGRTRYSRGGDGRAALGPMLREFLISEAMAALGIPTTRSLAVIETGEPVLRDRPLPGAILVRTAASHLRVGTFVFFAAMEDPVSLRALLDYTIARHYPELVDAPNPALALLEAVQIRKAALVARWMAVGFVHGVLNTDNVALSGETIDYGPCAFIDRYDPAAVYSSIDARGRYAYANQVPITGWNLTRFAESLLPLIDPSPEKAVEQAEAVLAGFEAAYEAAWLAAMRPEFGITDADPDDRTLIQDWLKLLEAHRMDFTNGFRALSGDALPERSQLAQPDLAAWRERLDARLAKSGTTADQIQTLRDAHNPRQIPRNHAVQKALEAAEAGDPGPFNTALKILRRPYAPNPDAAAYAATPSEGEQAFKTFCGT
jgi:uncharacterized protein YdiU (UPF0061 family)